MNTFDLSLDLDKRAGVTQWVTMRQGDHDGTQLRATIYDHGTQVSDSYTCRVSIRKPTDNEYYRETCSFSGGVAIVTVDEQYAASEVGITYGYFELLQGTAVIASTENFGVRILQSATDGAIVAPPYDSAIEDALAELDEATGRISQMVQDATAEYLEAHPELTTTVEDNSLTDAKLVQKGGILQREQWLETMLPNIPRKTTSEADVHSVTDSAGGGPLGIEVYGRSTQDGTPTPDAPVPIVSVGPDSDGGVKMVAQRTSDTSQTVTIPIDLGGRSLRSLPDGTRDVVNVDEWGHATLTQRVGTVTLDGSSGLSNYVAPSTMGDCCRVNLARSALATLDHTHLSASNTMADGAVWGATQASARPAAGTWNMPATSNGYLTMLPTLASVEECRAWLADNPLTIQGPLAEPVTIDLGYLDPALLPAPDLKAYVVPSAPSVLRYGFDVAQALAEIATT